MHTFMFSNEVLMLIILIIPWVIVIRLANDVVDGVVIEIAQELASFLDLVVEDMYSHEFTWATNNNHTSYQSIYARLSNAHMELATCW